MRDFLNNLMVQSAAVLVPALRDFMASPAGKLCLPELSRLAPDDAVTRGRLHKDNLDHSILVCGQAPARLRVRWAALYHDVGKAPTRKIEDGKVSFHGHEDLGGRMVRRRLTALGYDWAFVEEVACIVENSGRIASFSGEWTDSAVRRIALELGPLLDDALDLVKADCTSRHERNHVAAAARADGFRAAYEKVQAADREAARRPPIDGLRVMGLLSIPAGRDVGVALKWLLENCEGMEPDAAEEALISWWRGRR